MRMNFREKNPWALLPYLVYLKEQGPKAVRAFQNRRLIHVVRHAFTRVPHYRESFSKAGLQLEKFRGIDDLAQLPLEGKLSFWAESSRMCSQKVSTRTNSSLTGVGVLADIPASTCEPGTRSGCCGFFD